MECKVVKFGGILSRYCGFCNSEEKVRIICGKNQKANLSGYLTVCEKCLDHFSKKDYYIIPSCNDLVKDISDVAEEMMINIAGYKDLISQGCYTYQARYVVRQKDFIQYINLIDQTMTINEAIGSKKIQMYYSQDFVTKDGKEKYLLTYPNIWFYDPHEDLYWDMLFNFESSDLIKEIKDLLGYTPANLCRILNPARSEHGYSTCSIVPLNGEPIQEIKKINKVEEVKIVYL